MNPNNPNAPSQLSISELYSHATYDDSADWHKIIKEETCPYLNGKCMKTRKSSPAITIGTCTVQHGVRESKSVIICPYRFLERSQVFIDCLHLLSRHESSNELHLIPELTVPGGSVDYCLASVRKGKVVDFVGIELQAVDTTGTVWYERQQFLKSKGIEVEHGMEGKYGLNWKMSAKTTLIQLHHKIQTFENVNRKLVLVLQDHFLTAMEIVFIRAYWKCKDG